MNKFNFGLGNTIAASWIEIDYQSNDSCIRRLNVLTISSVAQ